MACRLPVYVLAGNWDPVWGRDLNPVTLAWKAMNAGLNTHPFVPSEEHNAMGEANSQ